jgi:mRNA (2'-O-methyladenosine-N6-)-methyltransferase
LTPCCRLVDEVVWVKMTVNRRLAKSHGFYLQHAKEVGAW